MTQPLDKCRIEFEKAIGEMPSLCPLDRYPEGEYICTITAVSWQAFQAAYNLRNPNPANEGDVAENTLKELAAEFFNRVMNNLPDNSDLIFDRGIEAIEALLFPYRELSAMPQPAGNAEMIKTLKGIVSHFYDIWNTSSDEYTKRLALAGREFANNALDALNNTNTEAK